ncbi:hypothetical protein ACIHCV_25985 [Streptomyces sp. NPDC051956]|uniref:hypothetical protein n=1 Tax=Streptomyces sp. NPDC051956 TaxID=3365677 RepID=UPI0037D128F0
MVTNEIGPTGGPSSADLDARVGLGLLAGQLGAEAALVEGRPVEAVVGRLVEQEELGVGRQVPVHVAAHLLEGGDALRVVEQLYGRSDVEAPSEGPQLGHIAHLGAHAWWIALLQLLCAGHKRASAA